MRKNYHHGDLRAALIAAAADQLAQHGLEQLSLRKLSDMVGVSRTGAYHHFANKNELVCAVAMEGFEQLVAIMDAAATRPCSDRRIDLRKLVEDYLAFALQQPELYELMFGRTIWKVGGATDELKTVAYGGFVRYQQLITQALTERQAEQPSKKRCLRVAQANWALIHGLCRLFQDGIYSATSDRRELIDEVVVTLELSMSSDRSVN